MPILNRLELLARPEVKRALTKIRKALGSALSEGSSFGQREEEALAVSSEAVRQVLREELQTLSDSLGDEVLVDGVRYRHHEPGADTYHSLCGPLEVRRPTYRRADVRNGPIVVAVELAAGLVEGATPALAYTVARGYAQHDMRAHKEDLEASHRLPPSRTTLERIATRLSSTAVEHAPTIERALRRSEKVPAGAVAVSIGLDRTSVPMIEDRAAAAPPKPERKRLRPRVRSAPPPFDVNWRMAYVGTVSFVDAHGEALQTVRYAAAACDDPRDLVTKMTADVRAALKRCPSLNVGIVQDGAHEMWNRTREGLEPLRQEGLLVRWEEGIDRYHLLERIADAMAIVEPDADVRKRQLDTWREAFDLQDSTIDRVEYYLRARYWLVRDDQREALWDHLRFIANNKDRMRYVTLRLAGLPVGSGVTESTCKTVFGHRTKRSGQRWREAGLRGVVTLRALLQSDRLPRFWLRLSRRYAANVEAA
jgi:hypothetical protein